jgi:hypothetical protein
MLINFHVALPDQSSAKEFAAVAKKLGYRASVSRSPECSLPWTCVCSTRMLATYEAVMSFQDELDAVSAPFGGHSDGWGTFGNGRTGQSPGV